MEPGDPDAGQVVDAGPVADAAEQPEILPLGPGAGTLAGGSLEGNLDGERNLARMSNPVNVVVGPDQDIYVADFDNGQLRAISPEGAVRTLDPGRDDFFRPFGMAFTPDGTLYVQTDGDTLDRLRGALWSVDPQTGEATLVRDVIGRMRGIHALPDGRLVMAEYQRHVIVTFDPETSVVNTLAGSYAEAGFADGTCEDARFDVPYDIGLLSDGTLVVSDWSNHRLRRVTLDGEVSTLAGSGLPGATNGDLLTAEFNFPQGIAVEDGEVIYVTDTEGFTIRRVDLGTGQVETLAGDGTAGHRDSENLQEAQFFGIEGIDIDEANTFLYVADGSRGDADVPYHRVRRLTLP